jgi:hypothetical protein
MCPQNKEGVGTVAAPAKAITATAKCSSLPHTPSFLGLFPSLSQPLSSPPPTCFLHFCRLLSPLPPSPHPILRAIASTHPTDRLHPPHHARRATHVESGSGGGAPLPHVGGRCEEAALLRERERGGVDLLAPPLLTWLRSRLTWMPEPWTRHRHECPSFDTTGIWDGRARGSEIHTAGPFLHHHAKRRKRVVTAALKLRCTPSELLKLSQASATRKVKCAAADLLLPSLGPNMVKARLHPRALTWWKRRRLPMTCVAGSTGLAATAWLDCLPSLLTPIHPPSGTPSSFREHAAARRPSSTLHHAGTNCLEDVCLLCTTSLESLLF